MSWQVVAKVATELAKRKLANKAAERGSQLRLKHVIVAVGIVTAPAALIALVLMLGVAAVVAGGPAAAAGGALGIPPVVFSAYVAAEANAPGIASDCQVDWPIVAGIWPLTSFRNALFMQNEVPGVEIPPAVMRRMEGAQSRQAQLDAGIEIARQSVARVAGQVAGIQVSAPFGKIEIALNVIEGWKQPA